MSLPVPASPGLRQKLVRLAGTVLPVMGLPAAVAGCASRAGVAPIAVLELPRRTVASSAQPVLVLIHAKTTPEVRVGLLEALAEEFPVPGPRVLALTELEWPLWKLASRWASPFAEVAAWGTLPSPGASASVEQARLGVLRRAAGLYLDELHLRLSLDAPAEEIAALGGTMRDLLAEVSVPARFPAVPAALATVEEQYAAAIGVFHAALGGESEGEKLRGSEAEACSPLRTASAARKLVAPLLADMSIPTVARMRALYLLPGPWGTRHQWRLVAVLPGDAPLLDAAALRRHLQQHLKMLPARRRDAVFGERGAPLVVTEQALSGLLTRRVFARPLSCLSVLAHRQLLVGEDVVSQAGAGMQFSPEDLVAEVVALVEQTGACWTEDPGSLRVRDLLFGAWPAVLHLARGGSVSDSLALIHESLRSSTDPALSRVGSAASTQAWGDPSFVDLSRSKELLREWGPTLLRLQEATLEALR